jgi:uncharacterized membrane protein
MALSLSKALSSAISLAVISITASAAATQTNTTPTPNPYSMDNMEKCQVIKNGTGMIKAHKSDCRAASGKSSCAGQNGPGEKEAWIFVPKGQCEKINMGDCSGILPETRARLEDGTCK